MFLFDTLPAASARGELAVAFGSSLVFENRPFHGLDQIAARHAPARLTNEPAGAHAPHRRVPVDFALLLGNFVHADLPAASTASDRRAYERKYRDVMGERHAAAFLSRVPSFQVWDDREAARGWDAARTPAGEAGWPQQLLDARAAYDEYAGWRGARGGHASDGGYHHTVAASGVALFVADTRCCRSGGSILGDAQRERLLRWADETARDPRVAVRVLASPAGFSLNAALALDDSWAAHAYRGERDEVLARLAGGGKGAVLLSAGAMHTYAARLTVRAAAAAGGAAAVLHELSVSPIGVHAARVTQRDEEAGARYAAEARRRDGNARVVLEDELLFRTDRDKAVGVATFATGGTVPAVSLAAYGEEGEELYAARVALPGPPLPEPASTPAAAELPAEPSIPAAALAFAGVAALACGVEAWRRHRRGRGLVLRRKTPRTIA